MSPQIWESRHLFKTSLYRLERFIQFFLKISFETVLWKWGYIWNKSPNYTIFSSVNETIIVSLVERCGRFDVSGKVTSPS